jgi:rsbT co-antagonist protein RsbR
MPIDISKTLLGKKKQLLESWINGQLANDALKEDLIGNEELEASAKNY